MNYVNHKKVKFKSDTFKSFNKSIFYNFFYNFSLYRFFFPYIKMSYKYINIIKLDDTEIEE